MTPAEQFFYTHAAYTRTPAETNEEARLRAAQALASAEKTAALRHWSLAFSVDEPTDTAFAILETNEGEPLATLPDLPPDAAGDPNFCRTVTAQLALNVLPPSAPPAPDFAPES